MTNTRLFELGVGTGVGDGSGVGDGVGEDSGVGLGVGLLIGSSMTIAEPSAPFPDEGTVRLMPPLQAVSESDAKNPKVKTER